MLSVSAAILKDMKAVLGSPWYHDLTIRLLLTMLEDNKKKQSASRRRKEKSLAVRGVEEEGNETDADVSATEKGPVQKSKRAKTISKMEAEVSSHYKHPVLH